MRLALLYPTTEKYIQHKIHKKVTTDKCNESGRIGENRQRTVGHIHIVRRGKIKRDTHHAVTSKSNVLYSVTRNGTKKQYFSNFRQNKTL